MSLFDQSFNNPSSCFAICNENKGISKSAPHRQKLKLPHVLQDDGLTTADRQRKQEIDSLLSQALNELTFEERQEQQEMLHGVEATITEETNFVEASLQELDDHLTKIKRDTVYEVAEDMDPGYVGDRSFRVMFLRGNRYDAREAADQMIKFFELKHQLFGKGSLVKDITINDLDEDDIACLKTGWIQLAGKDRSGRQIMLNLPGLRTDKCTLQNELRMRYYVLMSALESEETQIKGTVPIVYAVGDMKSKVGGNGYYEHMKIAATVNPNHMAGVHSCTDEISEHLRHYNIIAAASMKLRTRYRFHYGSQTECFYQLSTYGIPQSFLPVDPVTNKISIQCHLKWVESRFKMQRRDHPLPSVGPSPIYLIIPTENDVLVMGGSKCTNTGNQRLRVLVNDLSKTYETGSTEIRKDLAACVIHSVYDSGGRFLKQHGSGIWEELTKDKARRIVTQTFRNSYRRR